MATLAEKLAAKKAAAAQASGTEEKKEEVSLVNKPAETIVTGTEQPTPAQAADKVATMTTPNLAQKLENEVLTDANGKPLSGFALIQARKKALANVQSATTNNAGSTSGVQGTRSVAQTETQVVPVTTERKEATITVVKEAIAIDTKHEEALDSATPEARQAYSDLQGRLEELVTASGDDLKNMMQELKRALMQNPSAVSLMLPSDIGQMVIALRKMTGVELAKTEAKGTGKGRKPKEVALTAEQLEDAWKEL